MMEPVGSFWVQEKTDMLSLGVFAVMTGVPAATLLHLGPGLGNGLANLHNARRAATPLVNIVGDHVR